MKKKQKKASKKLLEKILLATAILDLLKTIIELLNSLLD